MHELSIAHTIVEAVERAASENGLHRVDGVHLQMGALSGVVKEALIFGFDLATEGTILDKAQLIIEELPIIIYCPTCQAEKMLPTPPIFRCPTCNEPSADLRQGKELDIVGLEVFDETATP